MRNLKRWSTVFTKRLSLGLSTSAQASHVHTCNPISEISPKPNGKVLKGVVKVKSPGKLAATYNPIIVNNLPTRQTIHQSSSNKAGEVPHPNFNYSQKLESLSVNELRSYLIKAYDDALNYCKSKKLPEDVDPTAVFACNRLDLRNIDVYGFDYDYTLASYTLELEHLIYDLGREALLKNFKV
jgi:hypothetical protein